VDDDQISRHLDLEIDVVLGPGQEHAPVQLAAPGRVRGASGPGTGDQRPSLGQFSREEVPRSRTDAAIIRLLDRRPTGESVGDGLETGSGPEAKSREIP